MSARSSAPVRLDNIGLKLGRRMFQFDCSFPAGSITAVVGPSGSGKSTLLNIVAGFERPERGQIWIAGQDVTRLAPAERPVSLVFQDDNLFAHLDLFTNIGLGIHPAMKLTLTDRDRIAEALSRVGLAGFERRMPGSLSGGERQRVAFARALVRRRPVLLLDEPFAALDPGLRTSMLELLLALHDEAGATILLVTHDPRDVKSVASRVTFINEGVVLLNASTDEFLGRHDLPEVAQFLGSAAVTEPSP